MNEIAVSQIAWLPGEEPEACHLLRDLAIRQIEVAPGRIWPTAAAAHHPRESPPFALLQNAGLTICGFQAILFGRPELGLFDPATRPALLKYLKNLAGLCASVGGSYLVFGAPKNRTVPEGMAPDAAREIAIDFFRELGNFAAPLGVRFGLEANPEAYGCNFCTHVDQVTELVRAINSPGVRWHLDTGELAMNNEDIETVMQENADLIGSVHVSEPNLGAFTLPWEGHQTVAQALRRTPYNGSLSIEMKRHETGLAAVLTAVDFVRRVYRTE